MARACPSPYGNRGVLDSIGRSRGTGPRPTEKEAAPDTVGRGPVPRRARDNREIARDRPSPYGNRGVLDSIGRSRGTGPRPTEKEAAPDTVGRGPVPRRARDNREIARDRPSRYGNRGVLDSIERSRGTGPRATVKSSFFDKKRRKSVKIIF